MNIKTLTHRHAGAARTTHSLTLFLHLSLFPSLPLSLSPSLPLSLHSGRAQAEARGEEGESSGAFLPHNDIPALIALRPRSVYGRRRQSSRSHIICIFPVGKLDVCRNCTCSVSRSLRSRMTCFSSNARLDSEYRKSVLSSALRYSICFR